MKKLLILSSLCLIGDIATAVPSSDPFANATADGGTSYDVGSNLVGQVNNTLFGPWYLRGGNFGTTQPTIAAGNLGYPDLPPSSGNSVLFGPDPLTNSMSACIDLNLTAGHSDTVYYSFLLKITDLSAVPDYATNNPFAAFGDDPSLAFTANQIGRLGSRLVTKKVGAGYVLGISRSGAAADAVYEPDGAAHNLNDVLFVVACYQRVADVQTNVNLWINPPASSFGSNQPPAPTLESPYPSSVGGAINNNSARSFAILCQFPSAPGGIIDDVRVAINDWAYVSGGDPAILTQPVSLTLPEGSDATFTVQARGTPTLTYQWYKDGTIPLSDVGNISGATTASLTVSNISASDSGDYSVTVMNGLGNPVTSAKARLALTDPLITGQPQNLTVNFSSNATFEVTATGTSPLSYQWHKEGIGDLTDGGNISGSQSNVLTLTAVPFSDGGNYWVTVSNASGVAVDSETAVLTVLDPFITVQPVSLTTNAGSVATFQVAAAGSGSLTYQWLKNGNLIFDIGNLSGTSTDTLTISDVSSADQAGYSATVYGPFSNAVSSVANLTVLTPASILIQPRPRAVVAGARTAFSVGAGGSGPFTYQWQREGTNIPNATAAAYVLNNVQADVVGNYGVVVSNAFSSVTSLAVALTVSNSLTLVESNLVLVRVGDGAQTLTINGSSLFLDQFTVDGSYVNTITIPDDGPTSLAVLGWENINGVNTGSTTGNSLTRSLDGRFMVVAGYRTNLNYGASLAGSVAASVPRGVGFIDSFGQYTLALASTDPIFDNTFWRAAITDGTNNFWGASGIQGTYYFGFDQPAALVQNTLPNIRSMGLFNGDIYCVSAAGMTGVVKINGLATAAGSSSHLFTGASGSYDIAVNPAGTVIYLTDQRNVGNGGGIQRWEFDGANWSLAYTLNTGFGNLGPRYITADFSGPETVLYVTSNDQTFDNNRLIKVVDAGPGSPGTTLYRAGANQTFRGLHFGPVPNTIVPRPVLSFAREGSNLILNWSGSFILQSAPEAIGTYSDVSGAASPYTNSVTATNQLFFRLRN